MSHHFISKLSNYHKVKFGLSCDYFKHDFITSEVISMETTLLQT